MVLCAETRRDMEEWLSALKGAVPGGPPDMLNGDHHWYALWYFPYNLREIFHLWVTKAVTRMMVQLFERWKFHAIFTRNFQFKSLIYPRQNWYSIIRRFQCDFILIFIPKIHNFIYNGSGNHVISNPHIHFLHLVNGKLWCSVDLRNLIVTLLLGECFSLSIIPDENRICSRSIQLN